MLKFGLLIAFSVLALAAYILSKVFRNNIVMAIVTIAVSVLMLALVIVTALVPFGTSGDAQSQGGGEDVIVAGDVVDATQGN